MWSIVGVLVIAGVFMAALSVFQELTQAHDNNFFGFAQVSEGGFDVGEGDDAVVRQRLAGPIGEQNRYAQVLLMVVPLAYFAGASLRSRRRQLTVVRRGSSDRRRRLPHVLARRRRRRVRRARADGVPSAHLDQPAGR